MSSFQVGEVYFGTLLCAHGDFPVRCTRRTDKSVWFEHCDDQRNYPQGRAKIRSHDGKECALWSGWYFASDKQTGGDFDPLTI